MVYRFGSFQLELAFILIGCLCQCQSSQPEDDSKVAMTTPVLPFPEILTSTLNAHGGLDQWQKMKGLAFDLYKDGKKENLQVIDLINHKALIFNDLYRLGFDGQRMWLSGQKHQSLAQKYAVQGQNPDFTLFAMPFILADERAQYVKSGMGAVKGTDYKTLHVRLKPATGYGSLREWIIYLDLRDHQMRWLASKNNLDDSLDLSFTLYKNWQWVNGLLLPLDCEIYSMADDSLSKLTRSLSYRNVTIDQLPPDQSMFLPPEDAIVYD